MKKMKAEVKRDRISELPEEIRERIISSLCMKDAVCTSSLSSVWRYTWVSLPCLDFGFDVYDQFTSFFKTRLVTHPKKRRLYSIYQDEEKKGDYDPDNEYNDWITKDVRQIKPVGYSQMLDINHVAYLQMVDEFLKVYRKKNPSLRGLKKMSLFVPRLSDFKMRDYGARVVSRCLSLAKHYVTELDYWVDNIEVRDRPQKDSYYALQYCLPMLESKTLTKLELRGCRYSVIEKTVDVSIDLPNLRDLPIDESMLETLLGNCQALEKFDFLYLKGFKVLRVPRLSKLKELQVMHIHDLDLVEINSMEIQCLTLINLDINKCEVKMASNSCNNLVKLFIMGCGIIDDFFNNVVEFPKLETVSLTNCPELKHIKITSNSLTSLVIKRCPNLSQAEVDTSNLLFTGYSSSAVRISDHQAAFPKKLNTFEQSSTGFRQSNYAHLTINSYHNKFYI